ncbi:hypothetical protein ACFUEN_28800 [Streptomyces griseorubiginosus]|uniref:hypothetical protein n=1 Tax=Streptomyces griseorubiginosus TaxID=67304 RepID=UPI00363B1F0A
MEDPRSARSQPRHPETRWDRTLDYFWFAERYQWTPAQVDDLPIEVFNSLPDLAELVDEIREDARERAQTEAERG